MSRLRTGRLAAALGAAVMAVAALGAGGSAGAVPAAGRGAPAAVDTGAAEAVQPTKSTMRIGPFNIAPTPLGTLPHQNRVIPNIAHPCTDCYITGITPRLVYADGTKADMSTGVMLHHLVIADTAKRDLTCAREDGIGAIGRRIFASGDERTAFSLPAGYGFKVTPGRWIGIVELMNHSPVPRDVFFEADVWHVPASTAGMKNVTPVWLDIANCLDSEYSVPAGRTSMDWSWVSSITGKVVAAAGHVHAGGVGTILTNGTTNRRMCSSEAGYGTPGASGHDALANMVTSMSGCSWDKLGTVRKGEKLTLTSIYDAPTKMDGVMGIMLLAVHETSDLKSGSAAPKKMRATPDTKVPDGVAAEHALLPTGGGHGH
jgi:hypothetical protein